MELPPISPFVPLGDASSELGPQWDTWKRSFEYYVIGRGITDPKRKRALLLHCAGIQVQEVFATLTNTGDERDYDSAITALDTHFHPLTNKFYERYKFRQMKQLSTESVDQFLARLRQQASRCQFADMDQNLLDQVIANCHNPKVRTKLLEVGNGLTLPKALDFARTVETVAVQERVMTGHTPATPFPLSPHLRKARIKSIRRKTHPAEANCTCNEQELPVTDVERKATSPMTSAVPLEIPLVSVATSEGTLPVNVERNCSLDPDPSQQYRKK